VVNLPPGIVVDRSDTRGGIRIVLKERPAPASRVILAEPAPPVYPALGAYPEPDVHVDSEDSRYPEPPRYPQMLVSEPRVRMRRRRSDTSDVIRDLEYVVVDVETTGGAPSRGHRLTEVAAVRMRGTGEITARYETLLNPERYIPPMITQLTGIDYRMTIDAPRFADIAEDVYDIIDGAVFVAHNAQFDRRFLATEFARVGLPMFGRTLCTVRLARKTVTEIQGRSLDALQYFFGVENHARHRAMGDARATALIFRKLLDRLDDHEVTRWNELEAFLRRRPKKKKKRVASPQPVEDTISI
jgi:DNA polymerase-3 subunit epsilon